MRMASRLRLSRLSNTDFLGNIKGRSFWGQTVGLPPFQQLGTGQMLGFINEPFERLSSTDSCGDRSYGHIAFFS